MYAHKRSWVWFLLPVFVHIIGGVIAYYALKPDEPRMAKDCLYIGITLCAIQFGTLLVILAVGFTFDNVITPGFDDKIWFPNSKI